MYIDGKLDALVLPGKTVRIPVAAGETHQVAYCAVFDVAGGKRWECSTPTRIVFDKGDSTFVISPMNQTLIACEPNSPC